MEDQMAYEYETKPGKISGTVFDEAEECARKPIDHAKIDVFPCLDAENKQEAHTAQPAYRTTYSDPEGNFEFPHVAPGKYEVRCDAFLAEPLCQEVPVESGCTAHTAFKIPLGFTISTHVSPGDCEPLIPCDHVTEGRSVTVRAAYHSAASLKQTKLRFTASGGNVIHKPGTMEAQLSTAGASGTILVTTWLSELNTAETSATAEVEVSPRVTQQVNGSMEVRLQRSSSSPTPDQGLWAHIRAHAKAISFGATGMTGRNGARTLRGYQGFIEQVLCGDGDLPFSGARSAEAKDPYGPTPDLDRVLRRAKHLPMHGMAAYELLRTATEIFLLWNCGAAMRGADSWGNPLTTPEEESARTGMPADQVLDRLSKFLGPNRLPYIERVVETAFPGYVPKDSIFCANALSPRADCVCLIELIWSYWHEEAMLVQTMNAISQRFQNVRSPGDRDPLAHVTIDPLRPLNNLIWGYVQDEQNRLTVKRRGAEYDHEYGITLRGKAVMAMRPADSRSKFLEGFHNLLHMSSVFYKEDNDTTVIADGFPLLNALKEVHLLLAQGAHNQFGDLPWTARVEMLMQQWLLARPEMREFLQSRPMVPYTEAWMPQVDTMKTLQGWSDVTVTHFHDLAAFGEQILLSIRYGDWIDLNDENHAKNWARYWRPEIQSYIHAYRTVTGIDLTNPDTVDYTMPAVHLQKRLALQRAR
jgi:hypothetical protein